MNQVQVVNAITVLGAHAARLLAAGDLAQDVNGEDVVLMSPGWLREAGEKVAGCIDCLIGEIFGQDVPVEIAGGD